MATLPTPAKAAVFAVGGNSQERREGLAILFIHQQRIVIVKRHVIVVDLEDQERQRGIHDPPAPRPVGVRHPRAASLLVSEYAGALAEILKRNEHVAQSGVPNFPLLAAVVVQYLREIVEVVNRRAVEGAEILAADQGLDRLRLGVLIRPPAKVFA